MKAKTLLPLLIITLLLSAGCTDKQPQENKKIIVAATIPPLAEFTEKVGGNKIQVITMVPPGMDPHTYEPKPSQLTELSRAEMYVSAGSGIEFELAWMDKLRDINKEMLIINASENITLIQTSDPEEEGLDVHTWTSIRNAKKMVENIYQGLIKIDPENKEYYTKNRDDYLLELEALDISLTETLKEKEGKAFIIYHPTLGYLARDYNLTQIAIEKDGKEPAPQWMKRVADTAKQKNIKVIIASPQFSVASAETIAREINGKVVFIDPLEKDYTQSMRVIAFAFNYI